jgi:hypothetical protein
MTDRRTGEPKKAGPDAVLVIVAAIAVRWLARLGCPTLAPETDSTPSSAQHPAAVAPREPRAHSASTADHTQASAEPAGSPPQARWPAPQPGTARQASPPGRPARGEAIASQRPAGTQQPPAVAAPAGPGGGQDPHRPAPPADWRDQILSQARERWQPGPSWPHLPELMAPLTTNARIPPDMAPI